MSKIGYGSILVGNKHVRVRNSTLAKLNMSGGSNASEEPPQPPQPPAANSQASPPSTTPPPVASAVSAVSADTVPALTTSPSGEQKLDVGVFIDKLRSTIAIGPYICDQLCKTITTNHAIIAGGCVLAAYGGFPISDIDIYVSELNAISVKNRLVELGFVIQGKLLYEYDNMFFKQNNILLRSRFNLEKYTNLVNQADELCSEWPSADDNRTVRRLWMILEQIQTECSVHWDIVANGRGLINIIDSGQELTIDFVHQLRRILRSFPVKIDLVVIPTEVPLTDVVESFDLTFCQTWFDGHNVFATHPTDVETKSGFLTDKYIKYLLNGNSSTHRRIAKYSKRGYKITYNVPKQTFVFDPSRQRASTYILPGGDVSARIRSILFNMIIQFKYDIEYRFLYGHDNREKNNYIFDKYLENHTCRDSTVQLFDLVKLVVDGHHQLSSIVDPIDVLLYVCLFCSRFSLARTMRTENVTMKKTLIALGTPSDSPIRLLWDKVQAPYGEKALSELVYNKVRTTIRCKMSFEQLQTAQLTLPQDLQIYNSLDVQPYSGSHQSRKFVDVCSFLADDPDNIVFVVEQTGSLFGWGTDLTHIEQKTGIVFECKSSQEHGLLYVRDYVDRPDFELYNKIGLDDANEGIRLSYLYQIRKHVRQNPSQRIFMIDEKRNLDYTSNINSTINQSLSLYHGIYVNIYGEQVFLSSAHHCQTGTNVSVYHRVRVALVEWDK